MSDWIRLRDDGVVALSYFMPADAAVMAFADDDSEHRRRFEFPDDFTPSIGHSEAVIAKWERERAEGTRFAFATRDASSGELLGGCELLTLEPGLANVSYWTYPAYRGRGVASRAVNLLCDLAKEELDLHRLEILTDEDHVASQAVAVHARFQRLGRRGDRILYGREL